MLCKICNGSTDAHFIGETPISGYYCDSIDESLAQPKFPLTLNFCESCSFAFYDNLQGAAAVLDRLYSQHLATYYSTDQLNGYLSSFADRLITRYQLDRHSTILEIGCNSGRLLKEVVERSGAKGFGIEPSKAFEAQWSQFGITVLNDYLTPESAGRLTESKFDVIYLRHVFEHTPNPMDFFSALASLCGDSTGLVIEVPYLETVIQNYRLENVSYSHLNYFSISAIARIARSQGMSITDFSLVPTDGGSIVVEIRKEKSNSNIEDKVEIDDIRRFVDRFRTLKAKVGDIFKTYPSGSVTGYGAGAKGQHLMYVSGMAEYLDFLIDDTPELTGKYVPGTKVRIMRPEDAFREKDIKAVINLAPTHREAIREKVPNEYDFIDLID